MKEYRIDEIEQMTWEQFLYWCDVSDWEWSEIEPLDIIDERENYVIARISISEILDQPDLIYEELDDGNLLVDWGMPVIIVNPDDDPNVYLRIWEEPARYLYHCDGQLYTDPNDIKD